MMSTLLTTKLHIPQIRPELVPRPALIERLNEGLNRKLILISAPAGFGKTTLLSAWIQSFENLKLKVEGPQNATQPKDLQPANFQLATRFAWLSLDEGDNDLARFLAYLLAAMQKVDAGIGRSLPPLVQSPQPPSAEPVLTALINDIAAISAPIVLVLDDYHLIIANPVHGALAFLLEHMPSQLHLVIAGRADPSLPTARLRARGQMIELRQADLCFSPDETTAFLNQTMGLRLAPEEVVALASRIEGWISGLQMAALALQKPAMQAAVPQAGLEPPAAFIRSFAASEQFILDYLLEEVLQRQPESIQSFLLQTSILERLCAPLGEAVVGEQEIEAWGIQTGIPLPTPGSPRPSGPIQQILEYLERANLFLVPLDDERRWFRYHQLFGDLLHKQLQHTQPEREAELHRRASAWFEANGWIAEAIGHALSAGEMEIAAGLIEQVAETTLLRGEVTTFMNWVEKLPEGLILSHPTLCLFYAWVLILVGRPLESIHVFLQSLEGEAERVPGMVEILNALIAFTLDQTSRVAEFTRQALERLPEQELFLRSMAARLLSYAQLADGELGEGSQTLDEVVRRSQQSGNIAVAATALCHLAELSLRRAQPQKAKMLYERALKLTLDRQGKPIPLAGEALIRLGILHREWNDLDTAARHITEGIELALQWRQLEAIEGYVALARVRQAQGKISDINVLMEKARQLAVQIEFTEADDLFVAMNQARLCLEQGELETAWGWAEERKLDRESSLIASQTYKDYVTVHLRKYEQMVLARLLIARKRPADALALLESLRLMLEPLGRIAFVMEIQMLEALAFQAVGDMSQARASLEKALVTAEPGGYVRLFVDEGQPMRELLQASGLIVEGSIAGYARKLLAAFPSEETKPLRTPGEQPPQPPTLVEPLSERELQVLHLLATSLSAGEIARQLFIAESTLRSHTKRIYVKLNVHGRLEAIQRARELQLL